MYSYKKATNAEKESVFDLYRKVMWSYISKIWGWDEEWQKNDFSEHYHPEKITLVFKENKLVGFSIVDDHPNQTYLRMIAIHPEHQHKGIGRKLLESVILEGKKQKKKIGLRVFKINKEARIFYEKQGFCVEAETSSSYIMKLN